MQRDALLVEGTGNCLHPPLEGIWANPALLQKCYCCYKLAATLPREVEKKYIQIHVSVKTSSLFEEATAGRVTVKQMLTLLG